MTFSKKYHQHVRNAVLNVCAKYVPVGGKSGKWEGYYGDKNYLDMSFDVKRPSNFHEGLKTSAVNCR